MEHNLHIRCEPLHIRLWIWRYRLNIPIGVSIPTDSCSITYFRPRKQNRRNVKRHRAHILKCEHLHIRCDPLHNLHIKCEHLHIRCEPLHIRLWIFSGMKISTEYIDWCYMPTLSIVQLYRGATWIDWIYETIQYDLFWLFSRNAVATSLL